MPNLLTVSELRALVSSPLDDTQLSTIISWVEAEITNAIGAAYVDSSTTITETVRGQGKNIFVKRPIESVSSVTEYASLQDTTGTSLTENEEFYVWNDEGRIERIGRVLGTSGWGAYVQVAYVPRDDREKRKRAIVDLVRVVLSQTALKSENVSGAFSYQAPENWEAEFRRVMRRLSFTGV